eukprot:TRINITY_DN45378_c0_g1_i1.p1 TRINITY_DN45378_c0_g1~~TRINITY_DN45378_c0_g1_i1.p1  ORF type:complete len:299 (+),score=77.85 TRINITY_DN45378_c0_g1_i1:2-898(+)
MEDTDITKVVLVSHISPQATVDAVSNFFVFCGPIRTIKLNGDPTVDEYLSAVIEFQKAESAETALLLTDAVIINMPVQVCRPESMVTDEAEVVTDPGDNPASNAEDDATMVADEADVQEAAEETQEDGREVEQMEQEEEEEEKGAVTKFIAGALAAGIVVGAAGVRQVKKGVEAVGIPQALNRMDEKLGLSNGIHRASSSASNTINKVDDKVGLSRGANAVGRTVATAASTAATSAQKSRVISKGVGHVSSGASSVRKGFQSLRQETHARVAARQQARANRLTSENSEPAQVQAQDQL